MVVGARDRAAVCLVARHCLGDQRHHVGEIDRAGSALCLLVNVKILRRLGHHVVVRIDHCGERLCIEQTFFSAADDVENVLLLVPEHFPGREYATLLAGVPQHEPFGQAGDGRVALQQPERERMKRHDVEAFGRRQLQQRGDAAAHLVGGHLGEGDGKNAGWRDAVTNEMNEATGERAGLARARPGERQLHRRHCGRGSRLGGVETPRRHRWRAFVAIGCQCATP